LKKYMEGRLARLEAILGKSDANEVDTKWWAFWTTLMTIVAFHAGKMSAGNSFEAALACAFGMTARELKNAQRPDYDGPNLWALVFEKLNDLATARGGRPIMENGSPVLERPGQGDDKRNGPR